MATKEMTDSAQATPAGTLAALPMAGWGDMVGIGSAWAQVVSDMSAEVIGFVAQRITEDVKTQHRILHCRDAGELRDIQAEFLQRAFNQYQDETGKLMRMASDVFALAAPKK